MYSSEQHAFIERLEHDLAARMEEKPRRLAHSLSVAQTAEQMAEAYGVSPFKARVAGILHDWDKVLAADELIGDAVRMGIDLGVSLDLVVPLLHGLTAAERLPALYPSLDADVLDAIAHHTVGTASMSDLAMIVFVADGIEPLRTADAATERVRKLVQDKAPLAEVYFASFARAASFVIETERYLYPGTIDTYNKLVLTRRKGETRS